MLQPVPHIPVVLQLRLHRPQRGRTPRPLRLQLLPQRGQCRGLMRTAGARRLVQLGLQPCALRLLLLLPLLPLRSLCVQLTDLTGQGLAARRQGLHSLRVVGLLLLLPMLGGLRMMKLKPRNIGTEVR